MAVFLSIPAQFERWAGQVNYGPAIRQDVIDRWRACGFTVYSVNNSDEAMSLAPLVRNVEIVTVDDMGRVRISSIAKIALQQKLDVTIISNADCLPIDTLLLQKLVERIGPEDVCIGERMNINPTTLMPTGLLCTGFDTFVFGEKALQNIPQITEWRIGDPVWDYWFPWLQWKMGSQIYNAGVPVTLHIDHPQAWNFTKWAPKLQDFFKEIPIGSDIFPQPFNVRYGKINVSGARFLTRLNISMALYKSLLEFPKLLQELNDGSAQDLKMKMLNASARQGVVRRWGVKVGRIFASTRKTKL